jgi:hypothetical protein
MAEIAQVLHDKFKNLTDGQRQAAFKEAFGTDAIRAANILYEAGAKGIKNFQTEMSKVTALQVAKEKMNNAAGAVEQFKGALETLQISVLLPLMPVIKEAANSAANFVANLKPAQIKAYGDTIKNAFQTGFTWAKKIYDFISTNWKAIKETVIAVTAAVVAYKAAMMGLMIIGGIIKLVRGLQVAYGLLTGAQWALNIAMDANPVGAIILAISALIGLGVLLYRNWDTVKKKAVELWNNITPLKGALLMLLGPIGQIIAGFKLMSSLWDKFKHAFSGKSPSVTPPTSYGNMKGIVGAGNSKAGGLANVPYNGYHAYLHKGERVLTPEENDDYNRGKGKASISISGNTFHVRQESDIKQIAYELAKLIEREGVQMA